MSAKLSPRSGLPLARSHLPNSHALGFMTSVGVRVILPSMKLRSFVFHWPWAEIACVIYEFKCYLLEPSDMFGGHAQSRDGGCGRYNRKEVIYGERREPGRYPPKFKWHSSNGRGRVASCAPKMLGNRSSSTDGRTRFVTSVAYFLSTFATGLESSRSS